MARIGILGAALLVECVLIKAQQVEATVGHTDLVAVLRAVRLDLVYLLVVALGCGIGLSVVKRRIGRLAVNLLFYVAMLYAVVINAASHGYFLATGSNLSWGPIDFWLGHTGVTTEIMQSEARSGQVVLFIVAVCAIAVANGVIPRIGPVRRRLERLGELSFNRSAIVTGTITAVCIGLSVMAPPAGAAMAVSRCMPVYIVLNRLDESSSKSDKDKGGQPLWSDRLEFQSQSDGPRPNIVLFIFEALNWKSTDVYFPGKNTTPFLADLAAGGTVVENHYTVLPHTTKSLVPILCGIYPYLDTAPLEASPGMLPRRCLPHILRSQDYATAFFQPARNFEKRNQLIANMGFELYAGSSDLKQDGFGKLSYLGKADEIMIEPSMRWVDSVRDRPFLLTYLTLATHHNYMTPHSYKPIEFEGLKGNHANYLNAVRYTDGVLERIFKQLEERNLIENTVFIVVGDHGEAFGEHGRGQHDLIIWEEGLRSASVLYGPKFLPTQKTIKGMRSHLDLIPTIGDLLGLTLKQGEYLGQSLFTPVPDDRVLYHSCWFKRQCLAMRRGGLKTIYHYDLRPMEVYDNAADIFDEHNLARKRSYDDTFLELQKSEMLRWKEAVNRHYEQWQEGLRTRHVSFEKPTVETPLSARFGELIEFVGYSVSSTRAMAGQDIELKYVFKCLKPIPPDHRLRFWATLGGRAIKADHEPVFGALPLTEWEKGQYVTDIHTVHIPGHRPSGEAVFHVGLEDAQTHQREPVGQTEAEVDDRRLLVTRIPVTGAPAKTKLTVEQRRELAQAWVSTVKPEVAREVPVRFGDEVELVGIVPHNLETTIGGTVDISYVFRARAPVPKNWRVSARLVRERDQRVIRGDHVPVGGLYPTGYWRTGEYIIDRHRIYVSLSRSKIGTYSLWLGFKAGAKPVPANGAGEFDDQQRVKLGTVKIAKPKMKMGRRF